MKRTLNFLVPAFSVAATIVVMLISCDKDNSPIAPQVNSQFGIVKGHVTYKGGKDFSGILVTLEQTTGGETLKIIAAKAAVSRDEGAGKIASAKTEGMTTFTDIKGYYSFSDVPFGSYALTARQTDNHLAKVSNVQVTDAGPTVVDIVLTPTANIVGTVLLEGLNDNSGVLVYLAGTSYLALTDSKGAYTISDVPLGAYELVVNAHEYDVAKAAVTLSIAGAAATVPVITLRKTGSILGHVVDAVSGAPLSTVIVKTLSGQADTTSADGVFALDNVPAGSALLSLTKQNYDVRWFEVPAVKSGEATSIPNPIKMYSTGKTPPDLDLNLTDMRSISGRIVSATGDTLSHVTIAGAALTPVTVTILKPDGTSTGIYTTTDAQNRYTLPAVPYGAVKLKFDAGKQGQTWKTGATVTFDVYLYEHFEKDITFDVTVDQWGWVFLDRNKPPLAEAGNDQALKVVKMPTVTLDGSGSSDPDGSIASYKWTQKSGTAVTLSNTTISKPTFTPSETGVFVFELTVKDNSGFESQPDQVMVSITKWALEELNIVMKPIPAGTFQMGTNYTVTLSAFKMSATEITQGQYRAVMGTSPSYFTGDDKLPVEQVSWSDAVEFCYALSDLAGVEYRLPTEAEWEYACRAGTTTDYNLGNGEGSLALAGWYDGNSGNKTHPVGQKTPNAWGLYDMHGNVWEWCSDWYGSYPGGSVTNPVGAQTGSGRVIRGGDWGSSAGYCPSANRHHQGEWVRGYGIGFRVVRRP